MNWEEAIKKGVLEEVWDSLGELQAISADANKDKKSELEKRIAYLKKHPEKQKPLGKITIKELLKGKRVDGFRMIKERIDIKVDKYNKIEA